jgi:hypothetical protein
MPSTNVSCIRERLNRKGKCLSAGTDQSQQAFGGRRSWLSTSTALAVIRGDDGRLVLRIECLGSDLLRCRKDAITPVAACHLTKVERSAVECLGSSP